MKKAGAKESERAKIDDEAVGYGKLEEAESVREFGARMQELGVREWWRKGMGYVHNG